MKLRPHYLFVLLLIVSAMAAAQKPHYQSHFPPEEFKARWQKVFDQIGDRAVAIVQGASLARGFAFPRQSNEFYYLSGIETPGAYIFLDGRTRKATIMLPPRNERLERSEGKVLSADDAELVKQLTGADAVASTKSMGEEWLSELMNRSEMGESVFGSRINSQQTPWSSGKLGLI